MGDKLCACCSELAYGCALASPPGRGNGLSLVGVVTELELVLVWLESSEAARLAPRTGG